MKNFPIDPHCKNCPLSGRFLQWVSMGKIFTRCRIWMKFGTRVRLKRWNDRGEFELDRARNKNNFAENSVALGHETNNRPGAAYKQRPVQQSHVSFSGWHSWKLSNTVVARKRKHLLIWWSEQNTFTCKCQTSENKIQSKSHYQAWYMFLKY